MWCLFSRTESRAHRDTHNTQSTGQDGWAQHPCHFAQHSISFHSVVICARYTPILLSHITFVPFIIILLPKVKYTAQQSTHSLIPDHYSPTLDSEVLFLLFQCYLIIVFLHSFPSILLCDFGFAHWMFIAIAIETIGITMNAIKFFGKIFNLNYL